MSVPYNKTLQFYTQMSVFISWSRFYVQLAQANLINVHILFPSVTTTVIDHIFTIEKALRNFSRKSLDFQ